MLTRRWRDLGLSLDDADFSDAQAVAAIVRMTGGNFLLLHRLLVQIERILRLNEMAAITEDVGEAARSTLVIGVRSQSANALFPAAPGRSALRRKRTFLRGRCIWHACQPAPHPIFAN